MEVKPYKWIIWVIKVLHSLYKRYYYFKPIQKLMTQSAGIALGGKRDWDLFRQDTEKEAFIPLENYIRIIIMCLPGKQNTPHKN